MREIVRVLKKDGKVHVFVPHFSNPLYFVDRDDQLKRKVPEFYTDIRINILSQKLKFRSSFALVAPFKKLFGRLINSHPRLQEYYEENLCYLFPCHGAEVVFTSAK